MNFPYKRGAFILGLRAFSKFLIVSVLAAFDITLSAVVFIAFSVVLASELFFVRRFSSRSEFVYLVIASSIITLPLPLLFSKEGIPVFLFVLIDMLSVLSIFIPHFVFALASIGFIFFSVEFSEFVALKSIVSELKEYSGSNKEAGGDEGKISGGINEKGYMSIFRSIFTNGKRGISIIKGESFLKGARQGDIFFHRGNFLSSVEIGDEKFTIVVSPFSDLNQVAFVVVALIFAVGIPLIFIYVRGINVHPEDDNIAVKDEGKRKKDGEMIRGAEREEGGEWQGKQEKIGEGDSTIADKEYAPPDSSSSSSPPSSSSDELQSDKIPKWNVDSGKKPKIPEFISEEESFFEYDTAVMSDARKYVLDYFIEMIQKVKSDLNEDRRKIADFTSYFESFEGEVKEIFPKALSLVDRAIRLCDEICCFDLESTDILKDKISKMKQDIDATQKKLMEVSSQVMILRSKLYSFDQEFSLKFRELEYLFHEFFSPLGGVENDVEKIIPLMKINVSEMGETIKRKFEVVLKAVDDFLTNIRDILESIQILSFNSEVRAYKIKNEIPSFEILSSAIGGMLYKMEELYKDVQKIMDTFGFSDEKLGKIGTSDSENFADVESLKNIIEEMKKKAEDIMGAVKSFSSSVIDSVRAMYIQLDKISNAVDMVSESISNMTQLIEYTESSTIPFINVSFSDISKFLNDLEKEVNNIKNERGNGISGAVKSDVENGGEGDGKTN